MPGSRFRPTGPQPQLYIMKAYHLYDDHPGGVKVEHMIADNAGHEFTLVFGRRQHGWSGNTSDWVESVVSSYGQMSDKDYVIGSHMRYVIDTGMGYKHKNKMFLVTGLAVYNDDGSLKEVFGVVPENKAKLKAFVFK